MVRIFAVVLIILGTLALAYQGFSFIAPERVVDAGPIQVFAERQYNVWIPPVVGIVAIVSGIALFLVGNRKVT